MRFLIVSQYFVPEIGAPQVRLSAFIRELRRSGHDVEVITALPNHPTGRIADGYRGTLYRFEEGDGVPTHRWWVYAATGAGWRRFANYGSFVVAAVLGLLRVRRPDYVFIESPPLFLCLVGFAASLKWRVPFIFNVADLWPDSVRDLGVIRSPTVLRWAEAMEAWAYRRARYVTAVTDGIRQRLITEKGVPLEKVLFLPNGVDTQLFRPQPADQALVDRLGLAGRKVLLYAGTLGYAQGLDVVLEAAERLKTQDPTWMILLVGDGSERERLERSARERKLDNVRFLRPVPPEEVSRLYAIAVAGFASLRRLSLFEGARPSKIVITMAAGRPVVYSGEGEAARLVTRAGAGVAVPPEDANALADAVLALGHDPSRAAQYGRQGRAFVETEMSWTRLVRAWLDQMDAPPAAT